MKRRILSIVFICIVFTAFNSSAQLKFGIVAGPQFATRNYNDEMGGKITFNTTLNAGLTVFIPLSKTFYLHETIGYSGKGVLGKDLQFTDNVGNSVGDGNIHVLIHYIELRTPVVYSTSISSNLALITGAGVYVGYAFGGYTRVTGDNIYTLYGEKKYDIDFDQDGYKRGDFGLVAELNFLLYNKIHFGLSTDLGLLKVEDNPEHSIKNTSFTISLGYLFNSRIKKKTT